MGFLYDILFSLFALIYLPVFFMKGKATKASLSRFGIIPEETRKLLASQNVLWVHAVSVGEVSVALSFLNRVRDEMKNTQFLITTTTVAGHEVAQKIKNEEDVLLYFPADFRFAVKAFIRKTSPSAVVLFETEIWPNLIWQLSKRSIPVLILNGRISDEAFMSYRRVRFFFKKVFRHVTAVGAQDERMRERFIALGADASRVTVTGNLKFDWSPATAISDSLDKLRRFCRRSGEFLWVSGSTHEGEEEQLFDVYQRLKPRFPSLRLLVAPRHLNRVADIEKMAAKRELPLRRISSSSCENFSSPMEEVWLLDQMGVLAGLYEVSEAAFVGGSLVPVGGHNLVEPAYFEKAIFFGPFMNNFLEMANEFKKNQAAVEVKDSQDLEKKLAELLQDGAKRHELGRSAKRIVGRHQGATEKNKDLLMNFWQPSKERKLVSA